MQIDTHAENRPGTVRMSLGGWGRPQPGGIENHARMAADGSGLAHGGFIFGLADYAAMIAVNHPNVVLGAAEVRFLKPVVSGETVVARGQDGFRRGQKAPGGGIGGARRNGGFFGDVYLFRLGYPRAGLKDGPLSRFAR